MRKRILRWLDHHILWHIDVLECRFRNRFLARRTATGGTFYTLRPRRWRNWTIGSGQ